MSKCAWIPAQGLAGSVHTANWGSCIPSSLFSMYPQGSKGEVGRDGEAVSTQSISGAWTSRTMVPGLEGPLPHTHVCGCTCAHIRALAPTSRGKRQPGPQPRQISQPCSPEREPADHVSLLLSDEKLSKTRGVRPGTGRFRRLPCLLLPLPGTGCHPL